VKHETEIGILEELIGQLDRDRNIDAGVSYMVPTNDYVCPDLAEKEWESFFREHPQFVGLSGDLPKSGSYFTTDAFGTPILVTRSTDGKFHAFVDACRHRGVKVSPDERGESFRFTCPFHSWTYASDGQLVGLPREADFGLVNKSCNGLIELPTEEIYGMLWVHPQPDGEIDVESLLSGLSEELADWRLGDFVYAGESVIDSKLNWKLANDTFGETYHFQRLHKETLGQIAYGDNLAYETFGRNHRFVFARKNIDRLRDRAKKDWKIRGSANVLYYLFPNVQLSVVDDTVLAIKIYPDPCDPNRSITRVGVYFEQEAIEKAKSGAANVIGSEDVYKTRVPGDGNAVFSLEASVEVFASTIENEDYLMGETTQKAALSGALKYLRFGRNEPALHHYHSTFRQVLKRPPLQEVRHGN